MGYTCNGEELATGLSEILRHLWVKAELVWS